MRYTLPLSRSKIYFLCYSIIFTVVVVVVDDVAFVVTVDAVVIVAPAIYKHVPYRSPFFPIVCPFVRQQVCQS